MFIYRSKDEISIEGTATELCQLAATIKALKPGCSQEVMMSTEGSPHPYDHFLEKLILSCHDTKVKGTISGQALLLEFGAEHQAIIASFFEFDEDAKSGDHCHFDQHGNEWFFDQGSVDMVIAVNNKKIHQPNILLQTDFIENPDDLFNQIQQGVHWDERMKARKTASFGVSYDYSGMTYPACVMPPELTMVCDQIEHLLGFRPNNCLINFYPDGESTMGFHSDSIEELVGETGVVIVSLGAEREICYRSKVDKALKVRYLLKHGSLLYMDQLVQAEWMHAIPKSNEEGARISLTFRCMDKSGTP